MVEAPLTQGGVYLARLDPAKGAEIGKIRPVVVLMAPEILAVHPIVVFVCPLSSQSQPAYAGLHVELPARDGLQKTSFALVEHCRSIGRQRILLPRIAKLESEELRTIIQRLGRMVTGTSL